MTHYLYRLYDREGDLLYIGVTKNPKQRFRVHAKRAPWGRKIKRRRLVVFPTLDAALDAERDAIRDERPRFNVVHNRAAITKPRPVTLSRSWFIVRVYDAHGRLLKIGQTQSIDTWWRGQQTTLLASEWVHRAARAHMTGPYEKPTMLRLVREARRHEGAIA